jgi:hypothetical protein
MFPNGPSAAADILIGQIIYKTLRLEVFMGWDMATGEATPTAIQHYIQISNSLRNDLKALAAMAQGEPPPQAPDLHEYLAGLEKANNEEG